MKKFVNNYLEKFFKFTFNRIDRIEQDIQAMAMISEIRNKKHFIQSYVNDETLIRHEKESPEQYHERCYLEAFKIHIKEEKEIVKQMLEIAHPGKSVQEIATILNSFY